MDTIDTLKNLERLEGLVEDSWHFAGFFRFNDEEFYMLVNKIRASLPEDMRRAGRITQNSERIVEAAQSEADQAVEAGRGEAAQIVQEARAQAQAMVEQSEIARIATAQAKEIVTQAEAEAREIRGGADEYARDVLANLENQVGEVLSQLEGRVAGMLSTIHRGRQKLEQYAERTSPHPQAGRPQASTRQAPSPSQGGDPPEPVEVGSQAANGAHSGQNGSG